MTTRDSLAGESCQACRPDSPRVAAAAAAELLAALPGWEIVQGDDGVEQLSRTFAFADFAGALAFANRVGALAEAENHHPMIVVEWGRATVRWWTHAIGGLHRNDFVMAARTG